MRGVEQHVPGEIPGEQLFAMAFAKSPGVYFLGNHSYVFVSTDTETGVFGRTKAKTALVETVSFTRNLFDMGVNGWVDQVVTVSHGFGNKTSLMAGTREIWDTGRAVIELPGRPFQEISNADVDFETPLSAFSQIHETKKVADTLEDTFVGDLVSPGAYVAERVQDLLVRASKQGNLSNEHTGTGKLQTFSIENPQSVTSRGAPSVTDHALFVHEGTSVDMEHYTNGSLAIVLDIISLKKESGTVTFAIEYPHMQLNIVNQQQLSEQLVEEDSNNTAIQPATAEQCIALIRMLDKLDSAGVASNSLRDL